MKKFIISTLIASILLIASCGDGGPNPGSGTCDYYIPPGQYVDLVLPDGTTIEGYVPEGGMWLNGLPCGGILVQ